MASLTTVLKIFKLALLAVLGLAACSSKNSSSDRRSFARDMTVANCDQGANQWGLQIIDPATINNQSSGLPANLAAVWGASSMAVWAVGSEGKVIFFDGQKWSAQATPTKANLLAVWGASTKDVWAAGGGGTVIRFDGSKWTDVSPPDVVFVPPDQDGGPPKGDARTNFRRFIWGLWGFGSATSGTSELYAVGERGLIIHWAKGVWIAVASGVEDHLNGIWGSGSTVTIVGTFGTMLTGAVGSITKVNTGTSRELNAVWGRAGHQYAIGQAGTFLHGSGGTWTAIEGPPKQVLRAMWGPEQDPSKLYIAGWDGTLLRLTGGPAFDSPKVEIFPCLTKNRLDGIWGVDVPMGTPAGGDAAQTSQERIWAVGVSGTVIVGP